MAVNISIIIPFYNRQVTLQRSVQSVLLQTYAHFELILVDDGSSDGSIDMLSALDDPRIRIIRHDRNLGAAAARNSGIRAATAPLVAFLDSDDVWHPDKLFRHVEFYRNSGAVATCTSFALIRENGDKSLRHLDPKTDWKDAFLYGCHVGPGSTMIADRAVFDRIGFLDETLKRLEDWDWLLRLVRTEKFAVLDEVLSDVYVSGYPHYEPVAEAIHKLRSLHEGYLAKDPRALGIFLSGLQIECAYISFHNELYKEMVLHLVKSVLESPVGFVDSIKRILIGRMATKKNARLDGSRKLLFVLDQLGFGGVERNTIRICNYLVEHGHEITLLCLTGPGAMAQSLLPKVRLSYLNAPRSRYAFLALIKHLRSEEYDAVISAKEYNNVLTIAASFFTFKKIRIITTTRTHLDSEKEKSRSKAFALTLQLARYLYPFAYRRIGVSQGVADNVRVALNRPDMQVGVIYNPAAEPEKFMITPPAPHPWFNDDVPVIVACGRLSVQKDFALLIDSFAELRKTTDALLIIVGDGELHQELSDQIVRLGLQNFVQLQGFTYHPEDFMYHARLFVLSSSWEGFGNVLVEALSVGCPVVSMDCPSGPSEILEDGKWGRLVKERTPQALANAIAEELQAERPSREKLRSRAAAFTPAKISADYLALLDD